MPTILPPPGGRRSPLMVRRDLLPATPATSATALNTGWVCLAGFFPTAVKAHETARLLAGATADAGQATWSVIGPSDSGWWRFRRRSRQWALQPHSAGQAWSDDPWLMALLGAVLAGVVMALWLVFSDDVAGTAAWLPLSGAGVLGALAGPLLAMLGLRQRQYRQFNRMVRQQLRAGRWAVLASDIAPPRQGQVETLVRQRCINWCSVSPAGHWL